MANLREPYAATSLANLAWDDTREKAIDRVAASGRASDLGVLLWKAKYMLESRAYARLQGLLFLQYRRRFKADSIELGQAIVDQALVEYIVTQCRVCGGVGERIVDDRRVVCEVCTGSKLHRYSDIERARRMQVSYALTKVSAYKIRWLLEILGSEDRAVNSVLCVELERDC